MIKYCTAAPALRSLCSTSPVRVLWYLYGTLYSVFICSGCAVYVFGSVFADNLNVSLDGRNVAVSFRAGAHAVVKNSAPNQLLFSASDMAHEPHGLILRDDCNNGVHGTVMLDYLMYTRYAESVASRYVSYCLCGNREQCSNVSRRRHQDHFDNRSIHEEHEHGPFGHEPLPIEHEDHYNAESTQDVRDLEVASVRGHHRGKHRSTKHTPAMFKRGAVAALTVLIAILNVVNLYIGVVVYRALRRSYRRGLYASRPSPLVPGDVSSGDPDLGDDIEKLKSPRRKVTFAERETWISASSVSSYVSDESSQAREDVGFHA